MNEKYLKVATISMAIGTLLGMIVVGAVALDTAKIDSPRKRSATINVPVTKQIHVVKPPAVKRVVKQAPAAKPAVSKPSAPIANPGFVQPRIFLGVKLYYQHNSQSPMLFIGTVVDAVGYGSGSGRTFSLRYAKTGHVEYKQRRILWEGCWYADREQQKKAIKNFLGN